jgi:hypothetical protein
MAGGQEFISWLYPCSTSNVALNTRTYAPGPLMGHPNWVGCDILHVSLCDPREACKNRYVRSCFERRFREANHPEALCFEGVERLMRRRNPDKGLKLIGDAAAEDPVLSTS